MIRNLYVRYKQLIFYAFFGICTTAVNMMSYYFCYRIMNIPNVPSTIVSWIVAVLFAYITNKLYVFDSHSFERKVLIREIPAFFGCRISTGILDVVIMYWAVDIMSMNGGMWKLLSNILVIVLNYIASRVVIFTKK